ncbi:MAG: glycoside hydrolase family 2 protein [Mucinivorans sp.]
MKISQLTVLGLGMLVVSCATPINTARLIKENSSVMVQSLVENWDFRMVDTAQNADPQAWTAATVPGTVHTDLMAAGVIGDPFASLNETKMQWIEDRDWDYRTTFVPAPVIMKRQIQELVFKGIDTYSDVYLNDSLILQTDNMFLEWRVNVTGVLKKGENTILVKFRNTYKEGLKAAAKYSVKLPADNDKGDVKTSVFTRKAPYNFGWDWGPRFLTVGIWKPVQLVGWLTARIDDVQFIETSQSEELATFDAHVRVISANANTLINVVIANDTGKIYATKNVQLEAVGDTVIDMSFEIQNPKLWWPNGTGEANLYPMYTLLANKDNVEKLDQRVDNIGVRTVRLVQEKDTINNRPGQSFYFEVNGEKVFAKGANYIPQDVFLTRLTREKYTEFIDQCKRSNYNMLRVWGGGIYEQNVFYDLCDKAGIMVWQDFMFACGFYPWDKQFLDNVRAEAVYNVRRLRNHPSIILWCGNNEIEEAWHQWGYQKAYKWTPAEQDMIWKGYKALFEGVLPDVLKVEDSTRYYHPSSPLYGRGDPRSQTMGDVHYWGVFHDEEPFSTYKDKPGRFSNEYGFQSLACYDTYREYFLPNEMSLYSDAMIVHQKNPKGYRVMEEYMVRDLPLLKKDFRKYVYLTQLLQAEGIKIAMEGHRQKRPFTMGSLYWQVNDCWPVASWSSIDSRGRWKALQYYAQRSFAPTAISFEKIDSTGEVRLWGVTDVLRERKGEVVLTLMDFKGKKLWSETKKINIPRNGNEMILHSKAEDLLRGASPSDVVLVADAVIDGVNLRALHYFVPFKDLKLPKPGYTIVVSALDNLGRVRVSLKAETILKSVLLEAEKIQGRASDAYFDMLPGEERDIELQFLVNEPVEDFGIFVTSLGGI